MWGQESWFTVSPGHNEPSCNESLATGIRNRPSQPRQRIYCRGYSKISERDFGVLILGVHYSQVRLYRSDFGKSMGVGPQVICQTLMGFSRCCGSYSLALK